MDINQKKAAFEEECSMPFNSWTLRWNRQISTFTIKFTEDFWKQKPELIEHHLKHFKKRITEIVMTGDM